MIPLLEDQESGVSWESSATPEEAILQNPTSKAVVSHQPF